MPAEAGGTGPRRRAPLAILALSLVAMPPGVAAGASFDCGKARGAVERMICADDELSGLDERMAAAFRAAGGPASGAALRQEQRAWLAARDRCGDAACLRRAYRDRIAALEAAPAPPVGACRAERGAAAARELVRRCIQVSPATRPPCHDSNPCAMIEDEIARGCGFLPTPRPAFCPR